MKPYYEESNIKLYQEDCLNAMKEMPDESVDLIVTDPPYGYSFMGKDWDTFNEVIDIQKEFGNTVYAKKGFKKLPRNKPGKGFNEFFIPIWGECLRVLKPGGFAFVMCAPRQDVLSKQIRCLQEVGFDMGFTSIYWAYASGFPKAENIGKSVDKKECRKQLTKKLGRKPTKKEFEEAWKDFGEVMGEAKHPTSKDRTGNKSPYQAEGHLKANYVINIPATLQAKALNGSYGGFQPKPAVEVILVAMKSLSEKTYVDQALSRINEEKEILDEIKEEVKKQKGTEIEWE